MPRHVMLRLAIALSAILAALTLPVSAARRATPARPAAAVPPAVPPADGSQRALLDKYCVGCHNQRTRQAGLLLDTADVAHLDADAETWEKVARKLRARAMPPVGLPRPDDATMTSFVSWLEGTLDAHAAAAPNPGRPAVHRLNRAEYTNAIRDLLGLEIDAATMLPADTSGFGFDNVADVLSVSSGLLDRYLIAARRVSRLALGDPSIKTSQQTYSVPYMILVQDNRMGDDLPFGSRGGMRVTHNFPVDGEYSVRVMMQRSYLNTNPRGVTTPEDVDIRLDGRRLGLIRIGGPEIPLAEEYAGAAPPPADEKLVARFKTTAGPHAITVTMQNRTWAPEGVGPARFPAASIGTQGARATSVVFGRVEMSVDNLMIEGPFDGVRPKDSPSRRKLLVCQPQTGVAGSDTACARRVLARLARRAYRRPATADDVTTLLGFYEKGKAEGGFDAGIQAALERALVSPYFLYRIERDPAGVKPGQTYRVSDIDLASRLSFFLWSSIPDDQLLDLATAGRLKDPAVLDAQVTRMLADPRSTAFTQNFFGQWLFVRNMKLHRPDQKAFMDFDENLRDAFITETEMFTDSQVRDDRPILDLLTADYTFVNDRLARHYGIPGVDGPRFRRVTLPDTRRAGILGQGSLLTVTSMSTRTSPVKRGAWLLANLLGTPPPPPPPNVPALPVSSEGQKLVTSLRERMEVHRRNPVCASCHSKMDPLGFALENFDGIGQWRDMDGDSKVDASGTLPDGSKFSGPGEFRQALLRRPDTLVSNATAKLLTYAMGRGVEAFDMPAVRKIVQDAAPQQYRWSAVIKGIVHSMPFQMRRAES